MCEYALAGTALLERTRETVTEAANHFHRIFRPHAFDAFPELFPPETVTFERYRWVLGMVWSRAFGLSPPRERPSDLDADDADVGLANAVRPGRGGVRQRRPSSLPRFQSERGCRAVVWLFSLPPPSLL